MKYYSGTTREKYEEINLYDEKHPHYKNIIYCWDSDILGEKSGRNMAIGWANYRAGQTKGKPVVIEIIKPEEFERHKEEIYVILKGRLTPENHKIYSLEELSESN